MVFRESTAEDRANYKKLLEADIAWLTNECDHLLAEASGDVLAGMRGVTLAIADHLLDPMLAAEGSRARPIFSLSKAVANPRTSCCARFVSPEPAPAAGY